MRVLVLRALDDARRTAARLSERGVEALISPVIAIAPLECSEPCGDFAAVIATSAHAFSARIAGRFRDAPLYVVGERTTENARRTGFTRIAGTADSAANLVPLVRAGVPDGGRLLYLAGRDRKADLERALSGTRDLIILETYAAEPVPSLGAEALAALRENALDAVLHYSRRSAQIFSALVAYENIEPAVRDIRHVAISRDAAAPLIDAGWRVDIASRPDEDAMIALVLAQPGPTQTSKNQQEEK